MNLNETFEQYRCAPTGPNLELLYPKIRERVVGVLRWRMSEDPDDSLVVTITNDVVLAIPKFNVEGPAAFSTWVERKVRNQAVDEARRRVRLQPFGNGSKDDDSDSELKQLRSKDDPSFSLLLREVFEQLTSDEQILLAGKLEKVSGSELAEKLGISASLVRKRWERLREKLRHILGVSDV